MAERYPSEGLDALLAVVPKGGATLANTYLGLFITGAYTTGGGGTIAAGTDIPPFTSLLGGAGGFSSSNEPASANGYARTAITAATWGAQAAGTGSARKVTTSSAISIGPSTGSWGTICGFFLAATATIGTGSGVAYYFANFSDNSTIAATSAGFTVQVTPYWEMAE